MYYYNSVVSHWVAIILPISPETRCTVGNSLMNIQRGHLCYIVVFLFVYYDHEVRGELRFNILAILSNYLRFPFIIRWKTKIVYETYGMETIKYLQKH